jgi:hypothetical protein
MEGWIASARALAADYRAHPERHPHLTAEERLRRAAELEECVHRVRRLGREERRGPACFDFEIERSD